MNYIHVCYVHIRAYIIYYTYNIKRINTHMMLACLAPHTVCTVRTLAGFMKQNLFGASARSHSHSQHLCIYTCIYRYGVRGLRICSFLICGRRACARARSFAPKYLASRHALAAQRDVYTLTHVPRYLIFMCELCVSIHYTYVCSAQSSPFAVSEWCAAAAARAFILHG